MRFGGDNFSYFPENQLTKSSAVCLNNKGKSGQKWLLNEQASTMMWPKSMQFIVAIQIPRCVVISELS